MLITIASYAYDVEVDGIYYNLNNSTKTAVVTCRSTSYNTYSGSVTIPASITVKGNLFNVTSIGQNAFIRCSSLTSVDIPNSVTSIGNGAFEGCTRLASVDIPNCVTSIGNSSFSGCSGLTSIDIPSSVTSIGDWAFSRCSGLTSIDIPSSVTSIGECAFSGCRGLTSVIIPDRVTFIGWAAFEDCSGLTSVKIGDGVTEIGSYAFSGCYNLKYLAFGNSVTSVGYSAFDNCGNLDKVNISDIASWCNIEFEYVITNDVGDDETSLSSNPLYSAHNLYLNDELVTDLVIPDGVKRIRKYAFYNCSSLKSVTIPGTVTSIGEDAFSGSGLTSVTISEGVTSIGDWAFRNCSSLTSVTIPSTVTNIWNNPFGGCTSLPVYDNLRYADSYLVETVDKNISSVSIKNGTRFIGAGAFYDCEKLASISIPNSVFSIGYSAFQNCFSLTSVNIPNSVTRIGSSAFEGCIGLTSVDIPNSVTSIGVWTFKRCSALTSVNIPNSVTDIGEGAFDGCSSLTTISFGTGIKNVDTGAFGRCDKLQKVNISNLATWCNIDFGYQYRQYDRTSPIASSNPLYYAHNLYLNDELVTDLVIPDGVKRIRKYAFYNCSSLKSVTIPGTVTSIGEDAFENCTGLTSVTIGNGVTSIGDYAFRNCTGLMSVIIPNSVEGVSDFSFYGCSNLTNVSLGTNVGYVNDGAFANCANLEQFVCYAKDVPQNCNNQYTEYGEYIGTNPFENSLIEYATLYVPDESVEDYCMDENWGRFGTIKGISSLMKAVVSPDGSTITFYFGEEDGSRQGTTYTIDNTASTPEWLANAATITKAVFDPSFAFARPTTTQRWFSGMKNLKTIEGMENLNTSDVTIMSYMFLNCQSLETLDLSHFDTRKVDKMGYMLQGCTNLKSVDLTGFETAACTSFYQMFKNCSSLESLDLSPLTITEGVESRYMLNGCTVLKNLTIPETAANLNNSSFVTVGTSDAPCELHAPEGFDFGTDTNGAFQWKSGWFYLAVPAALTATVASLSPGSTASLAVNMTNGAATSYNGYEMVLTLPEGMALAKSGSHFDCTLGDRYSANDFSVSINDLGGGAYRIIGFSLSNTTVTGSDGPLFLLKVTCPEGVATGSYTGTLEDISLSTTAGTGEEPEDVTFPITVSEYRLGDVDLNGKVNVVDVMLVVNRVLGETAANYHDEYADMDGNGKVNVVDIMTIIDVILTSPRTAPMPLTAMTNYNSHLIISPATTGKTGGTILSLDGTERFTACQMDIRLDGSTTLRGIKLLGANASTHSVKYFHVGDDLWRVVVYSTKGAALESNAPLLQLITDGQQHASIENIEMCNTAFDTVTLDCMEGSATAIAGTATDADAQQVPTYTIQGIRTNQPQRGVSIRNGVKVTVK